MARVTLLPLVSSQAPWVRQASLLALRYIGVLAPPEVARALVKALLDELQRDPVDWRTAPAVLEALQPLILEADDEDVLWLMPILDQLAQREPNTSLVTDSGVMNIACRLYRFRPSLRRQAAAILGEMAIGDHTASIGPVL